MTTRYSIEVWVFRKSRVLLLEVDASETNPRFWQPITGGILDGESAREAAVREMFEETGIQVVQKNLALIADGFLAPIDQRLTISKTVFLVRIDEATILLSPEEHIDYKWVEIDEVADLLHWESNRRSWELVHARNA